MFRKLFGETETIQFDYLKPRIIMAFIVVAGILIGLITHFIGLQSVAQVCVGIAELFYVILALMFGWRFLKSMFGFASLGALFSGNIVFGVVSVFFTEYRSRSYHPCSRYRQIYLSACKEV